MTSVRCAKWRERRINVRPCPATSARSAAPANPKWHRRATPSGVHRCRQLTEPAIPNGIDAPRQVANSRSKPLTEPATERNAEELQMASTHDAKWRIPEAASPNIPAATRNAEELQMASTRDAKWRPSIQAADRAGNPKWHRRATPSGAHQRPPPTETRTPTGIDTRRQVAHSRSSASDVGDATRNDDKFQMTSTRGANWHVPIP